MSVKLIQNAENPDEKLLSSDKHQLFILSSIDDDLPLIAHKLNDKLKRIKKLRKDLSDSPVSVELDHGGVAQVVIVNAECTTFERHALIRKAVMPLLEERPETLSIIVLGNDLAREKNACAAYYTTLVNAVDLPTLKKDVDKCLLKTVKLFGFQALHDYAYVRARVAGNTLCRQLSLTPPNQLTPAIYREKLNAFSQTHGWQMQTYDMATLKTMGAGAFVAVGLGSDPQDAAIVHLSYSPKNPQNISPWLAKAFVLIRAGII